MESEADFIYLKINTLNLKVMQFKKKGDCQVGFDLLKN